MTALLAWGMGQVCHGRRRYPGAQCIMLQRLAEQPKPRFRHHDRLWGSIAFGAAMARSPDAHGTSVKQREGGWVDEGWSVIMRLCKRGRRSLPRVRKGVSRTLKARTMHVSGVA
ncbi:hypothetical protein FIBSPDRAFT_292834 [Athelia psychrophila]|uniref:Uncharacterized protein n=1 Tax=Athelia psychrophila TaxID=1759441 RepID=A0A166R1X3_9AGAM|nr:hypothetical protein FIBSPDRAFT_292834 [Fibularhizoctonia sp. CBS 109695]